MKYVFSTVIAKRYGGNCHMFYGTLNNGNWFYVTDSWDYCFITRKDLSDYIYDDAFEQHCMDNLVEELNGNKDEEFRKQMIEWLVAHQNEEFSEYY